MPRLPNIAESKEMASTFAILAIFGTTGNSGNLIDEGGIYGLTSDFTDSNSGSNA
jgi:hypothetical protein